MNRRFRAKLVKWKTCILSKLLHRLQPNFCTVIQTTKFPSLVVPTHKSMIADGRHLGKIEKSPLSQPRFERFRLNLAQWRSSTLFTAPTVNNLKFQKSKMAAAATMKNPKIAISRQRFDRSPRNLARWRNSILMTRPTVRNLWFQKSKNRHISTAVSAISMKFGTVTQFDPLVRSDRYKFKLEQLKMAEAIILKNPKWSYLGNGLSYRHNIWHDDAYWTSKPDQQLKFRT